MKNITHNIQRQNFRDWEIRVILDSKKDNTKICLEDLCVVLKRKEILEYQDVVAVYESCEKIGKIRFISSIDAYKLLRKIGQENKKISKLCGELENWIADLRMNATTQTQNNTLLPSPTTISFEYRRKPISFMQGDKTILVNATELGKLLGKNPSAWLRLMDIKFFRSKLVSDGLFPDQDSQLYITRGGSGATWLCEILAIEFAKYLSDDLADWLLNCLEQLQEDGLKSMLKRHKKTTAKLNLAPKPETLPEALSIIDDLNREIEENQHKVDFYNEVVENRTCFKSSAIADVLDTTVVQLNRFLLEKGVVDYKDKRYIARNKTYQSWEPYLYTIKTTTKTYAFGKVLRWTPYGRDCIIELWNQHNK